MLADGPDDLQIRHIPAGLVIPSGLTFHVLEVVADTGATPIARIDAVLYAHKATPILSWQVTAPAYEYRLPHLWLSVRSFVTEGDAIDALGRLRELIITGALPDDLRDVI